MLMFLAKFPHEYCSFRKFFLTLYQTSDKHNAYGKITDNRDI